MIVVGTCSLCGGAVVLQKDWYASVPQTPKCNACWAIPESSHGPVIHMKPAPRADGSGLPEESRNRGGAR